MNWIKYNLAIAVLLLSWLPAKAEFLQEYTKTVEETFSTSPGSLLHLENRYGDIKMETWDQSKVWIEVNIKVKASSQSKADKIFELININLGSQGDEVYGYTELSQKQNQSGWWDKLFNSYDSGNYEINYTVKLPSEHRLNIVNKYGNIYHSSATAGKARFENKYGNIYTSDIDGPVKIQLGYGNAKVGNTGHATYDVKYSHIKAKNTGDLEVSSKYSDFVFGNVGDVKTYTKYDEYQVESATSFWNEGKYDDFIIGEVGDLSVDSKYSSVRVKRLLGSADLDGKYNDLALKSISDSARSINISGKYTGVKLAVPDGGFSLDFEGEYINPKIPVSLSSKHYDKDDEDIEIRGTYGGGHTKITSRQNYGSFKMVD